MSRPRTLTATFVRSVKQPGRYGDGRGSFGLSLLVKPTKTPGRVSKTWAQQVKIGGRPTSIGLGSYPRVTLAEARRKALHNRREIDAGRDPRGGGVPTLRAAVEKVLAIRSRGWKPGSKVPREWRASLGHHAGSIMDKRVDKITSADVLGCVAPIWHTKPDTARRVRQRISAVMKWAIAEGHRPDDPAGEAVLQALPRNGKAGARKHHKAIRHERLGEALRTVRESGASPSMAALVEYLALTACRTAEVRGAKWSEVEDGTWTIPAERMKMGREHRVPLSSRALAILAEAASFGSEVMFPSPRTGRAFAPGAVAETFRALKLGGSPHGLRTSFRTWAGESRGCSGGGRGGSGASTRGCGRAGLRP